MFTDKTGTLTENEMQFRECSINGIKYQEVNGKLTPEGFSEDSPDGNRHSLVRFSLPPRPPFLDSVLFQSKVLLALAFF